MVNIAQGEAKCYIFHETLTKSCMYISYKRSSSVLSILLCFTFKEVLTKYTLKFNALSTHLLNKLGRWKHYGQYGYGHSSLL